MHLLLYDRHKCSKIACVSCITKSSGYKNRSGSLRSILNSPTKSRVDVMKIVRWWTGTRWTCSNTKIAHARWTTREEMQTFRGSETIRTMCLPKIQPFDRDLKVRVRILLTRASIWSIRSRRNACTAPTTHCTLVRMLQITKTTTEKPTTAV